MESIESHREKKPGKEWGNKKDMEKNMKKNKGKKKRLSAPRLELGTSRVWGERDNHYTMLTCHE